MDVVFEHKGGSASVSTVDISEGGFYIELDEPLPIGEVLDFTLSHSGLSSPVKLTGRVIHLASKRGTKKIGVGIEIQQIAPGHWAAFQGLYQLIQQHIED